MSSELQLWWCSQGRKSEAETKLESHREPDFPPLRENGAKWVIELCTVQVVDWVNSVASLKHLRLRKAWLFHFLTSDLSNFTGRLHNDRQLLVHPITSQREMHHAQIAYINVASGSEQARHPFQHCSTILE